MIVPLLVTLMAGPGLSGTPSPAAIEGGDSADEPSLDSAVYLFAGSRDCSAVMVTPSVGLTAGHCLADWKFGQQVTAFFGAQTSDAVPHQVARWGVHPGYCRDCDDDRLDLAFIELTLPVEGLQTPAVPVATQDEWDQLMHEGQSLTQVGFGDPTAAGALERRRVAVTFDELDRSGREFSVQLREGGPCGGDSGGPLFGTLANGEQRLVGIHSRSVGGCPGTLGISGVPYPSLCWLRDETDFDGLPSGDEDCRRLNTGAQGCSVGRPPRSGAWMLVLLLGMMLVRGRAR